MFRFKKINREKVPQNGEQLSSDAHSTDAEISHTEHERQQLPKPLDEEMILEDEFNDTFEIGDTSTTTKKKNKDVPFEIIDAQGVSEMRKGLFSMEHMIATLQAQVGALASQRAVG